MALADRLRAAVRAMPRVDAAFAYGSAVFPQHLAPSSSSSGRARKEPPPPMADVIVVARDPLAWHAEWLERLERPNSTEGTFNRVFARPRGRHYSRVGRAAFSRAPDVAPSALARACQFSGAGVWFNTDCEFDVRREESMGERMNRAQAVTLPDGTRAAFVGAGATAQDEAPLRLKYGVIATDTLKNDLTQWSEGLYVSGRLHKPVLWLARDEQLEDAISQNHRAALAAAVILAVAQAGEHRGDLAVYGLDEVFRQLVGLSYLGDIRGVLGAEDPKKVQKIAVGSASGLRELYVPLLKSPDEVFSSCFDFDEETEDLRLRVPAHDAASRVATLLPEPCRGPATQDADGRAASLRTSIQSLTRYPSIVQSLKGLISAGFGVSVRYGLRKLRKGRS
jgi:Phosphatidate cytidylyltransferase, mitochondrial